MKRLLSLALVVSLVFTLCAFVGAMEPRATRPTLSLTFDGTTAYCEAKITNIGASINATMTLKQGNTVIASWSGTDTSVLSLEGKHAVTKGSTYTLAVSGTANGTPFSATTSGKC